MLKTNILLIDSIVNSSTLKFVDVFRYHLENIRNIFTKKNIMKLRYIVIICFQVIIQTGIAQEKLNNYAYVIVPEQFSFQNSKDQYQLNSLTKFLFEKEGLKVFWDTEKIPKEYVLLDCGGLKLKMNKKSSMFKNKVNFDLTDCYNTIVFTSDEGSSSIKEYKKGYQESVRNAFKSFSGLNYAYTPIPTEEVALLDTVAVFSPKLEVNLSNSFTYTNEANLVIELTKAKGSYIGKVKSSESIQFESGDVICKLFKTSLPNVFKAQWKDSYGNFINTIAYFNEEEELNIDFSAPTGITVLKFTKQ